MMEDSIIKNNSRQAFSEVYDIINHLEQNLYKKIPTKFVKLIKENRDLNYVVNIDYTENINKQKLLKETRVILSLIYRDYLVTPEERKKLLEQDKIKLKEEERELQEKYEIHFKKEYIVKPEQALIEVHDSWFKKIINKIKHFFKMK